MRILLGISRPGYNAATATTYCVESRQSKDILPDLGTAFSMVVGTKLDRQPRQTASAPQPNQMSVVFFFLTWREIEWGAEKISLRSFRQRRKVINTDSCRAKLESPTHNLMLYFTARCRFYQNNTRARSDQNASEQIASAMGLLQVCCMA